MAIRILIADDQPLVCQGLRMYLGLDDELEVVGIAALIIVVVTRGQLGYTSANQQ